MRITITNPRPASVHRAEGASPFVATAAMVLLSLVLAWQVAEPLRLAAMSALLISAGMGAAAIAWLTSVPRDGARWTLWEAAGLLVFLGFAAAIVTDPDEVVSYLGMVGSASPR